MKYLYAIAVLAVLLVGIGISLYVNDEPGSIAVLAYKAYRAPAEFRSAILGKVKKPLAESKLVLLGVSPGQRQDIEFWKDFLSESKQAGIEFQAIVIDPKLPFAAEAFPNAVKIDLKNEIARFAEGAKNAEVQNIRMVVIAPNIYTAQILTQNSVSVLKVEHGLKPLSLSLTDLPRNERDEANMENPCKLGDQDKDGTGALGCVILKRAKPLYRKPVDPVKHEGLVDQLSERDFLIYWNPPQQN